MSHGRNSQAADSQKSEPTMAEIDQAFRKRFGVAYADLTVLIGGDMRENTRAAFRKALEFVPQTKVGRVFKKAMVINTGNRQRWALEEARRIDNNGQIGDQAKDDVWVVGSGAGELCKEFDQIIGKVERHGIEVVIINSWEFASENSRFKEKLLFQIRRLINDLNVTVIVYSCMSQVSNKHEGRLTRGLLGKLTAAATMIGEVPEIEEAEAATVQEQKVVEATPKMQTKVIREPMYDSESHISKQYVSHYGTLEEPIESEHAELIAA